MKRLVRKVVLDFQRWRRPSLYWMYLWDGDIYLKDKRMKGGQYTARKAKWLND